MIWHSSSLEAIQQELSVDPEQGLSAAEVVARIQTYGENNIKESKKEGFPRRLFLRVTRGGCLFLYAAAAIFLATGLINRSSDWYQPLLVVAAAVLHTALDLWADCWLERRQSRRNQRVSVSAKVRRDQTVSVIDAAALVPGDIVLLEAGDYIPADGRLLSAHTLICEESAVTGDAAPNKKQAEEILADICPVSERSNMVYAGCSVTYGYGEMIVTETGLNTEIGRQKELSSLDEGNALPIRKKLADLGQFIGYGSFVVAALILLFGLISGPNGNEGFSHFFFGLLLLAATLVVTLNSQAAVHAVDTAFGFGVRRLQKKKIILKDTASIERLGAVSVILSDKTGTLTKNRMKVAVAYDGAALTELDYDAPSETVTTLIRTAALCTNANVSLLPSGKQKREGDATEAGIVAAALQYCGLAKEELENIYPRMAEVPFDGERKRMTTVNMINNRPFAIVRGSLDMVAPCCTAGHTEKIDQVAEGLAARGMRVIAVAIKPLEEVPANPTAENLEYGLTMLGMFGLSDLISLETRNALKESAAADIRTVMMTGDHITTATAMGKSLGLLSEGYRAVTGEEIAQMDDTELMEQVDSISVCSRLSGEDKLRLIEAWQAKGRVVAVTGDSVADAAALKTANIGCAMGVTGTDISKGSADIILTEDSYISIVSAVQEAKAVYANLKHMTASLLGRYLGISLLFVLSLIGFGTLPLSALALLWAVALIGFAPTKALGAEPVGKTEKIAPPLSVRGSLFGQGFGLSVLGQGLLLSLLSLMAYALGRTNGEATGSAMAFLVFALSQTVLSFCLRKEHSLFLDDPFTNRKLWYAVLAALLLAILSVATPFCQVLGLGSLSAGLVGHAIWLSLMPLFITEGVKWGKELYAKRKNK